jgi:uncharacterized protein
MRRGLTPPGVSRRGGSPRCRVLRAGERRLVPEARVEPLGRLELVVVQPAPPSSPTLLRADVYLPESAGPHPTVLVRSPYGRGALASLPTALPYAARGYAVVLQSVRGTFGSGGEFEPVVNEAHDGRDTIAWLRGQDWFDGPLALLGLSYLAYSAWRSRSIRRRSWRH